ncbi:MAG TPA: PQQ-dependent sugar dehydrogenase [Bryobacteraceae bacterium]|nr:PQQ-dependent sugar dehydrogenase [Bryobacteraceae bacterium]
MTSFVNRCVAGLFLAACALLPFTPSIQAAALACDPDNGGLKLPEGFCAFVAADGLGHARHMAVASNGDVYVSLQGARGGSGASGGVVALRDKDGDGRLETKEPIAQMSSATGIALHNGYLYVVTPTSVVRYKMTPGTLKPTGAMETVVTGLEQQREHAEKGIAFDGKGSLYINIGAPSNACQSRDRQAGVPGQDPCPLLEKHGGIWKFDENKLNQTEDQGTRIATGLRQMPAVTWHDGAVYIVMNNRDSLDTLWPGKFTAEENATRQAEPMYRIQQGANYGWPYCFYDYKQKKLFLNPEYGGDGKTVGRCTQFSLPITAFPAHWAPVDVMFYTGKQFPAKYRNGAFIAFHGSWNRAPMPQDGYNVTFQPFKNGKPSGEFEIFAQGFAGKSPLMSSNQAEARADGVAQAPDGSLYICESQKGKVWRVIYKGGK